MNSQSRHSGESRGLKKQTWIPTFVGMTLLFLGGPIRAAEPEWISRHESSGPVGNWTSYNPKISGDGRFVAFEARDASIPSHKTKFHYVFLYDRNKQFLRRLEPPNVERSNSGPTVSEGGRYVAYQSYPLSAVMGEPPLTADIVIYDRFLNRHTFQSFGINDRPLDGENLQPVFSADGRTLVFTSNATIFPGRGNAITRQIYLYDTFARTLTHLSVGLAGEPANRSCGDPRVSRNGRVVAFKSVATNLVRLLPLDSLASHLYVLDRKSGRMARVDEPERGFDSTAWMLGSYDMDQAGLRLILEGRKRIQGEPMKSLTTTDLFLFEQSSGTVAQLSIGMFSGRLHSPSLSGNGRFVACVFRGLNENGNNIGPGLLVYDIEAHRWDKVVEGAVDNPAFSRDGRWISYESTDKISNVFVVKNPFSE